MLTIRVVGEGCDDIFHFPMPAKSAGDAMTICGFCDVSNEESNHVINPVTCVSCIAKVEELKAFKLPKGWKQ